MKIVAMLGDDSVDDDHNDAIFIVETVHRCLKIIDDTSKKVFESYFCGWFCGI